MPEKVIVWFRQDLRLQDHPALSAAAAAGEVIPLYILDDETPQDWRWGGASRWWLHYSLASLGQSVPLYFRRGETVQVLREFLNESGATSIYFTRDYAPCSEALEDLVKAMCDDTQVSCHRYGGYLLHEPEAIRNGAGTYFKVYTPFSRACFATGEPRTPKPVPDVKWCGDAVQSLSLDDLQLLPQRPDWAEGLRHTWAPGEAGAAQLLGDFLENGLKGYAEGRDRTDLAHTSRLSPHLHWGEISPHQVWAATRFAMSTAEGTLDRDGEKFLKEVLWREFAYSLLHHNPTLPTQAFKPEYNSFPWREDQRLLKAWQKGQTGYPIVDAGMRELWATGIMHNRVRMVAASFLIKHLLQPWQAGEKWFWDTLVDADIGNNAASWQWVAGCGADASPYYRIFNPMLQGAKFDPHGHYVKRWVPELAEVPVEHIHAPWEMAVPPKNYPKPIVDHAQARFRAMEAFQAIKS
jgi:deoxyribodipyrimidine photo-lyase